MIILSGRGRRLKIKIIISDTETTPIPKHGPTEKMWIFGGMDYDTGEITRFEPFRGKKEIDKAVEWASTVDLWVGHNFISFDIPQIAHHVEPKLINPKKVLDTLIVSKLVKYDRMIPKGAKSAHSLDAHGIRLGVHKGSFNKFDEYSEEMVRYWEQDLAVNKALYESLLKYIKDPDWQDAIRVEHDIEFEMQVQKFYGFHFNKTRAQELLTSISTKMDTLEANLKKDFPPKLEPVKVIKYRVKQNGEKMATVVKAESEYPLTKVDGEDLVCYDYVPFKPGSPQDRIEVLWEAGWKPFDKTKSHQEFGRKRVGDPYGKSIPKLTKEIYDKKKKHFDYYGWKCNEDNLATLPESAPKGARLLAQWLTLEGRRSSLVEWINECQDDSRIHGSVTGLGAWTHRAAHKGPNTANIAAPFHGTPRNDVEKIKAEYDGDMRGLWDVPEGSWLVGVDAEGIQLRVLGDMIWRHIGPRDYADTICKGDKALETDIHNVNKRALSLNHLTRDDAKTFIYAWALNAGIPKLASILRTNVKMASVAKDNFERSIPGLKQFKDEFLTQVAKQGYFTGYDGRKVIVPSLHKTLAGILQNGEAVVLKHSKLRWAREVKLSGIRVKPVGFIHDEFQAEVIGTREEAEHVKNIQIKSIEESGKELGFLCPLAGSGDIGKSWKDTH